MTAQPATSKLAVILFNLGGPSGEAALQPFLFNFFRDKNVITLPNPFRYMLAAWISWNRSRGAGRAAYAPLGGKSPLLENTQAQAVALEAELQKSNPATRVFVSMRYWHPLSGAIVKEVAAFQPDEIVLLPLYPQYSTTTSFSSLQNWCSTAEEAGLRQPQKAICCYPTHPGFIKASAALIEAQLKTAPKKVRVLFSAHGLPEKIIQAGDPYQQHCEQSAFSIAGELGLSQADWQICYQSRIGRLKWIGPSIEEALQKAADDKVGVLVYPLAFVSEHVETLVELDIEYKHRAAAMGIHPYIRVRTVGTHPQFIAGLRDLVLSCAAGIERARQCPENFCKCYREGKNG